ncbi:hypothetical protein [Rhodococcus chondri]|uniref:Transposase n=1 Tax=Rhodococcus chondri TaxID=3065941 RepID=A0ABU7JUK7_9NOCA|nr:hypothetical protein [Rhodococcus sp. CC-R104]MEE2033701.1 hypothetical protein [Rhodococcus sp. CC-R104]
MATLDTIADELYALDPAEFVEARSEYAAKAREAGDRELTAAIGRLRKPTVAAWMVNLLARERADELGALFDLGDQLRTAQRKLSGHDLRRLSAQRRQVVALLERDAGRLASKHGRHVSDGALREVSQTLTAALADREVAERVRAGRLDAIVEYSGFGDLSAVPLTLVPDSDEDEDSDTESRTSGGSKRGTKKPERGAREPERTDRKRAEAAERKREECEQAAADAASARKAADEARTAAEHAQDELAAAETRVAELREKLAHAEQQREFARSAVNSAKKDLTAAERAASAADAALVRLGG